MRDFEGVWRQEIGAPEELCRRGRRCSGFGV